MDLELTLHWQSQNARHHDGHFFAGVDLAQTDLPLSMRGGSTSAEIEFLGSPARIEISPYAVPPVTEVNPCGTPTFEAGYQPIFIALTRGIELAAQPEKLASLKEPYPRPHADDAAFYATPRIVDHLDRDALQRWTEFHGRFLNEGDRVLDLMASHDSHLPTRPVASTVIGLGMNAEELAANPSLTGRSVHDLNASPHLPMADASVDLALCALSIEYLTDPVAVLKEVKRVLRPGGGLVVSFSERWFPPKAVLPWPKLPPFARVAWVMRHFAEAGFSDRESWSQRGHPRPSDDKYFSQTTLSDPLYAVSGVA